MAVDRSLPIKAPSAAAYHMRPMRRNSSRRESMGARFTAAGVLARLLLAMAGWLVNTSAATNKPAATPSRCFHKEGPFLLRLAVVVESSLVSGGDAVEVRKNANDPTRFCLPLVVTLLITRKGSYGCEFSPLVRLLLKREKGTSRKRVAALFQYRCCVVN